jgi:hypothetical protein
MSMTRKRVISSINALKPGVGAVGGGDDLIYSWMHNRNIEELKSAKATKHLNSDD